MIGKVARRPRHLLLALALALCAPPLTAQAQSAPEAQAERPAIPASDPAPVEHFTLENGLEVVVVEDRRAPVVTHMLWYKAGSADEPPGKSGIAHFLEHLMFKGTVTAPAGEFSREVAAIGGRENAFTSYDYTAYHQQVSPEALEMVMRYEADRMTNLLIPEDAVAPERDVVKEERRTRTEREPRAILGEEMNATLYQNHPYRNPVIGWMHEIETLSREDAMAFYRSFYRPDNAVLIVAGDVEAEDVRRLAQSTYGSIDRPAGEIARDRPAEPQQKTRRSVSYSDPRVSVPSFRRAWLAPSYSQGEARETAALDILAEVLGGGPRSRLYETLVVEKGIASSAGAYFRGSSLDQTSFDLYASPSDNVTIAELEAAVDAVLQDIRTDGITEAELERAQRRSLRAMIFARDSQAGMARMYGAALTTGSTVKDVQDWPDQVRKVTVQDVTDVARRYLDNRVSVTGYLVPPADDPS